MTPEQFCYWLQGWSEMEQNEVPTPEQWRMIQEHLKTVFVKVTPPLMPSPVPFNPPMPNTPWPRPNPWQPGDVICSVAEGYRNDGVVPTAIC